MIFGKVLMKEYCFHSIKKMILILHVCQGERVNNKKNLLPSGLVLCCIIYLEEEIATCVCTRAESVEEARALQRG